MVPSLPMLERPPATVPTALGLSKARVGAAPHTPDRQMVPPAMQSLLLWQQVCVEASQALQLWLKHTSLVLQAVSAWHLPQAPSEQPSPAPQSLPCLQLP